MMLVIETQHYENYGAHDWDGVGQCPSYWKAKGGSSIKVINVPEFADLDAVVDTVRDQIEENNQFFQVQIIGYGLQPTSWLSWFEKSQLEYDGVIQHPEQTIDYQKVVDEILA